MTQIRTSDHRSMPVARTLKDLRAAVGAWRAQGRRVALVPTMGALHEGHLSLVELAGRYADHVVVSVFVNPTQFAPHEDFASYPRTEASDLEQLARTSAALAYCPTVSEIYPPGNATTISVAGPALGLESETRPHFFGGVATVVSRLLTHCAPDVAVFGEKDYQQLLVIRRMVADLALPVTILAGASVREADGLALSSRNRYLSAQERQIAPAMNRALNGLATALKSGRAIAPSVEAATAQILAAGFTSVDYVAARNAETLEPIETFAGSVRLLAAARLGKTRLIDNIAAD